MSNIWFIVIIYLNKRQCLVLTVKQIIIFERLLIKAPFQKDTQYSNSPQREHKRGVKKDGGSACSRSCTGINMNSEFALF